LAEVSPTRISESIFLIYQKIKSSLALLNNNENQQDNGKNALKTKVSKFEP
jgi:hypothetical protein